MKKALSQISKSPFTQGIEKAKFPRRFHQQKMVVYSQARFSKPDRSLNRIKKRFKVFEVEPGSNRDDIIINLIIN